MVEWPPAQVTADGVTIASSTPLRRFSLRTRAPASLPERVLSSAAYADGHALCLGPDEWLLLLPEDAVAPAIEGVHALTDVSHRQVGLSVTGARAVGLIQTGVALDLALPRFSIGKATRTLFETVEIVLWRRGEDSFHIETWRSFAPYLWQALTLAA